MAPTTLPAITPAFGALLLGLTGASDDDTGAREVDPGVEDEVGLLRALPVICPPDVVELGAEAAVCISRHVFIVAAADRPEGTHTFIRGYNRTLFVVVPCQPGCMHAANLGKKRALCPKALVQIVCKAVQVRGAAPV